jgi:chemotaxis protein methyltransferase CheR
MKNGECVAFLQWALPRLGLRWPGFRKVRGQVCKRIRRRIQSLGLEDFGDYCRRLAGDESEWAVLDGFCRITISRFYRDKNVFRTISDIVLPELAERASHDGRDVGCWCAGCASGEEVYTLRLLWDLELGRKYADARFQILGTDVDESVLARAAAGCYEAGSFRELPAGLREKGFEKSGAAYCVKADYRHEIAFQRQDIRQELPGGPFDLVLCRNVVLTYFEPELQARLVRGISSRLRLGGYLVIGAHEALPAGVAGFEPIAACPKVLRWKG